MSLNIIFGLIRFKSYLKNLIIFLPLFLSYPSWSSNSFISLIPIFVFFNFLASCIYIINDLLDLDLDKKHHRKKFRPIASGLISTKKAILVSGILGISSFTYFFLFTDLIIFYLILTYFILNTLYSSYLKNIKYLELIIILSGFIIRVFIGSLISDIVLSSFLIIQLTLFVLFILVCKRREYFFSFQERIESKYSIKELNISSKFLLLCNILNYFIYLFDSKRFTGSNSLEISFLIFSFLLIRYFLINNKNIQFDPISIYTNDKIIIFFSILYILNFILGFYGMY